MSSDSEIADEIKMRWTKQMYVDKFGLASHFGCIPVWFSIVL